MAARLVFSVIGSHTHCPICKGWPKECPHSLAEMDQRLWENWIRNIVRAELKKKGEM